jgi:hypothetical protein
MSEESRPEYDVRIGTAVYDDDGNRLGTVRGIDEHGFQVTAGQGITAMSIEHVRAGHRYAEGELMWRCYNCGEFGDLEEELPEGCPGCGGPKEDLYYYTDD